MLSKFKRVSFALQLLRSTLLLGNDPLSLQLFSCFVALSSPSYLLILSDKETICKNVSKSFTDELLLYQSAIQDFKNELKERLTKRVQSIRPKSSDDFIDMSLRSESSRYALFRDIMAADEKDLSEEEAK